MRKLSYVKALNEALHQILASDDRAFLIGQGVTSPWYVGQSCVGLPERFGDDRIIDTPVSENGVTGMAVGAALNGMRPILVHPRLDFMYYGMDPIANQAANWYYMFGDQLSVPMVIWGIINRGGEQGAQHAQAIQAIFAHLPGLKVVMPSTPYDVKGLLISSVRDGNPVVFIDERWLYAIEGEVPEEMYEVEIGKAKVRREGEDLTIITSSFLTHEALKASEVLEKEGISVEILDLLSIKPLDTKAILRSVSKTGRTLILDGGWRSFGVSAEVSAVIAENGLCCGKGCLTRMALPDLPAPASRTLETAYYPNVDDIVHTVREMVGVLE